MPLQRLQPHPQLLVGQQHKLDEPFVKVRSSSSKKFVLLFKSVLVADVKIDSNKMSSTLFEKFIISLHFTKFDIIN